MSKKCAQLQKSKAEYIEKYKMLLNSIDQGYFVIDIIFDENDKPVDMYCVESNAAGTEIFGMDFKGKRLSEINPNYEEFWYEIFGEVAKTGKGARLERYAAPDKKWFSFYIFKIGGPESRRVGNIFLDITERKNLEQSLKQSEKRYRELFDSMNEFFFSVELIYDNNGKEVDFCFLDANPAGLRFVNMTKEEMVGKKATELFSFVEDYWINLFGRVNKTGTSETIENYSVAFDKWFSICAWKVDNDKIAYIESDITEHKSFEKKLKDSERLAAIGATAGMVGHDIRNPLQAMTSDIYLINDNLSEMPNSKQKYEITESLASIVENISYINKIVADLQDYAKPLKPEYSFFDLPALVRTTIGSIVIPSDVKLTIKEQTLPKIESDQTFIRRSISNLISNAIQAMPKGGHLDLTFSTKENKIFITVSDTGVGIPEEIKASLFNPMVTTKSKGQGFGLAVAKRLVEALGGTIRFESKIDKGTQFSIELPFDSRTSG